MKNKIALHACYWSGTIIEKNVTTAFRDTAGYSLRAIRNVTV